MNPSGKAGQAPRLNAHEHDDGDAQGAERHRRDAHRQAQTVRGRSLGVAVAALEDSLAYAQDRRTFGQHIWKHQLIGNYLADMATKLTAARQFADIGECLMAEPLVVALVPGVTLVSGSGEEIIELVSANIGVAVMPQSVARALSRKDVVARPLRDAPDTGISLVWPAIAAHPLCDVFVGIVRGRTANSSR